MVKSNYIYLTLHQFGTGNFFIDLEEIERVFVEKQRFEDPAGKDWSGLAYAHELWTEEKKQEDWNTWVHQRLRLFQVDLR